jgi:hypothetical protein
MSRGGGGPTSLHRRWKGPWNMSASIRHGGVIAIARAAALAGLLGAAPHPGPGRARPAAVAAQPAAVPRKESPYARYAREHAMSEAKRPARVKLAPSSAVHRQRSRARSGRR